jgi:hypothetical protein
MGISHVVLVPFAIGLVYSTTKPDATESLITDDSSSDAKTPLMEQATLTPCQIYGALVPTRSLMHPFHVFTRWPIC